MKLENKKMQKVQMNILAALLLAGFVVVSAMGCQPAPGNFSEPVPLKAAPVPDSGNGTTPGQTTPPPIHQLFNLLPGQSMTMSSMGIIDPVGTTIAQDFDGDGIINDKELVSNFWVADYPMVESSVAPPITMEIKILKDKNQQLNSIVSDITSSDMESRRNRGSEKFHQNELALRTVQYKYSQSSGAGGGSSFGLDAGPIVAAATGGASAAAGLGSIPLGYSNSNENSHAMTMDKFVTKPFRNNIDRDASSIKNTSSKNMARQYRNEKNLKVDQTSTVESNAGFVRAALYIKNSSVNMPVKLSNILCSLLFETATGELIPVRSFELRNQDYSMFTVEVYGNSEFGPYVIDLPGLNTVEIENAIALGYTPKIFIVDYQMTHVADSNYRAALSSSFTGDNLKIIEENAKGRTALIKLIGPGMREMFRVTAFSVDTEDPADPCKLIGPANTASPGITMKKALERIACSGVNIQFGHYIFDFMGSDMEAYFDQPVYSYAIKSINGLSNNFPCHAQVPGIDQNGNSVTACMIRVRDLTPEEDKTVGVWTIFDNGKYFDKAKIVTDGAGTPVYFEGSTKIIEGVHSTVWAGDNYDVVFLSMSDILQREREYGSNPLETNETFFINTRWNNDLLGQNPDYPEINSVFLGQSGPGEKIEITIQLKDNWTLNPDFGQPVNTLQQVRYDHFSYFWKKDTTTLHSIGDAFDFQISFDQGGTRAHWYNILRTVRPTGTSDSNASADQVNSCGESWSFLSQVFTVCVQVPTGLPGVSADGVVNVYLRPAPNNAYREVIWPRDPASIYRYQAWLFQPAAAGDLTVRLLNESGEITTGTGEAGTTVSVGQNQYTIASIQDEGYKVELFLGTVTTAAYLKGEMVSAGGLSGTVWEDTPAGTLVLPILPDAASLSIIQDPAFDALPYKNQYLGVGTDLYLLKDIKMVGHISAITLQSALLEDHSRGELTSIKGFVNSSQVFIAEDTDFLINWNAEPQNASTGLLPDYSSMLYTGAITGCYYGLDSLNLPSPGCQGYPVDSIVANWAGAGAFENDWNDSSNYYSYMTGSLNPLVVAPTSQKAMSVEVIPSNVQVSGPSVNQKGRVLSASGNGRSLVTWEETADGVNWYVKGRIYDNVKQSPLSAEFTISDSVGDQKGSTVSVSGNKAIVVWQTPVDGTWDVKARVIDLSQPATPLANPIITVNTTIAGVQTNGVVDTDGDIAVVAFIEQSTPRHNARGRLISLTGLHSGPGFDSEFIVTNNNDSAYVNVAFRNKKIVFMYSHYFSFVVNAVTYNVYDSYMRLYTVEPFVVQSPSTVCSTMAPSEYNVAASRSRFAPQLALSADGSKGMVGIYRNFQNQDLYAVPFDFASASCATGFNLSYDLGVQGQLSVDTQGDYAVATWVSDLSGNFEVHALVYNLITGQTSPVIVVNSVSTGDQKSPAVRVKGNYALVTWKSLGTQEVRGQVLDLVNGKTVDASDFYIGPLNASDVYLMTMAFDGTTGMMFWQETDIFGRYITAGQSFKVNAADTLPLRYGLNNFFIAPLVERNYAVKARLIY